MTQPNPAWVRPGKPKEVCSPYEVAQQELFHLHCHKNTISGFKAEQNCGRTPVRHNGKRVGLKVRKGKSARAFYSAIQHSTAHSCPIAYTRARASRQADMAYLVEQHREAGGMVLSGSFGMAVRPEPVPFPFYDPKEKFRASAQWKRLEEEQGKKFASIHNAMRSEGWEAFTAENQQEASYARWGLTKRLTAVGEATSYLFVSRDFTRLQKRLGIKVLGYVVATEIEVSPDWSPDGTPNWGRTFNNAHIHFLLFLNQNNITDKQLRALLVALHRRWATAVKKHGFRSTLAGSYLRPVVNERLDLMRIGKYITKGTKSSGDPTRLGYSYWDALRDSQNGDFKATNWWRQYEGAVRGRRLFRISHSLMKAYALTAERERRFEEWKETQPEPITVAFFDRKEWLLATSISPQLRHDLLKVAEKKGVSGTRKWLEERGIPYHLEDEEEPAQVA